MERQDEGAVYRRRRNVLKTIVGGATLSLTSSNVGAEGRKHDGETASDGNLQGRITNTVRDANDQLNLTGSGGWRMRNVGFRNFRNAGTPAVVPAVTNSGQTAVIEGCYFGDGGNGPAMWVHPDHAGTLVVRNSYFEGWGDNGIYGSPPGNPSEHPLPGSGGVVRVENCYSKGNATSNLRLGTDGSYIKNCVSFGSQRGYWGFYGSTRVINCDIGGGIHASASSWGDPAVVTIENTRFSGGKHLHYDGATINGTSQGQPRDYYPGVPLSPTDAKNGNLTG